MSSGGKSSGQTTQVTKSEPWAEQIPYLTDIFAQAKGLSGTPIASYPGQTYAAPSWETQRALELQAGRALAGSPVGAAASGLAARTLGGGYLSAANPYFEAALGRASDAMRPRLDAQFAGAGRYGSGAHARAMASAMADTAGELAFRNYEQERQNQMSAIAATPQLAMQDYIDIARLAEVGGAREDAAQQGIDEARARFELAQGEPWERLARYAQLVQGNYGGTQTTTVPSQRRTLGSGFLGGLAPLAIGTGIGMATTNPWLGIAAGAQAMQRY